MDHMFRRHYARARFCLLKWSWTTAFRWAAPADPRLPPDRRAAGDMTHSVAIIDRPWHWRDKFPATNTPSAEIARKAREQFGWLLDGAKQD